MPHCLYALAAASDCLDRILILGRRHLEHVLTVYRGHYNQHRADRALDLLPPDGRHPIQPDQAAATQRVLALSDEHDIGRSLRLLA